MLLGGGGRSTSETSIGEESCGSAFGSCRSGMTSTSPTARFRGLWKIVCASQFLLGDPVALGDSGDGFAFLHDMGSRIGDSCCSGAGLGLCFGNGRFGNFRNGTGCPARLVCGNEYDPSRFERIVDIDPVELCDPARVKSVPLGDQANGVAFTGHHVILLLERDCACLFDGFGRRSLRNLGWLARENGRVIASPLRSGLQAARTSNAAAGIPSRAASPTDVPDRPDRPGQSTLFNLNRLGRRSVIVHSFNQWDKSHSS